jgi:hypothetical protein
MPMDCGRLRVYVASHARGNKACCYETCHPKATFRASYAVRIENTSRRTKRWKIGEKSVETSSDTSAFRPAVYTN